MRRAGLLIAALTLVGGCAAPTSGIPSPAPSTSAAPHRPRELKLDGIDPCSLLTPKQVAMLGLRDGSQRRGESPNPAPGASCSMVGFEPRAIGIGITLATSTRFDDLTRPRALSDQLTPIAVRGFRAVLARTRNPDVCFTDVDVADGQVLDVQFSDGGRRPPIPQDQLCRDVITLAEQVLDTLLRR